MSNFIRFRNSGILFALVCITATHTAFAAEKIIVAQKLVNEITQKNSDLLMLSVHAEEPSQKRLKVVASNLECIGKEDTAIGLGVIRSKRIVLCPNTKGFRKYEIQMPLIDRVGRVIGWLDFIYKFDKEPDETSLLSRSLKIREQFNQKIFDARSLFNCSL